MYFYTYFVTRHAAFFIQTLDIFLRSEYKLEKGINARRRFRIFRLRVIFYTNKTE